MDEYKVARRIAEGRFGTVFEATKNSTGQRVAIKKVRARRPLPGWTRDLWSKSAEREIEVLSSVKHENVVALFDYIVTPDKATTLLIYEYLAWDLATLLERRRPMEEEHAKAVLQMLLRGLAHLHLRGVMHRDLKPPNLLLEGFSGVLKIADFGSARFSPVSGPPNEEAFGEGGELGGLLTREVCTRWYKSPEMLFGAVDYTLSVDLWAVGCVAAELLSPEGKALFPGNSDLEELCLIFQLLGTPREDEWPEVCHLPDYSKVEFKPRDPRPFDFQGTRSPAAVRLVQQLLQLTPARRMQASSALEEEFFWVEPLPVEPCCLVQGLSTLDDGAAVEAVSDFLPLHECDYGSDDSCLGCMGSDFEPVEIETTACGLWDDAALSSAGQGCLVGEPCTRSGHQTPPPPANGEHCFKARR